MDEDDRCDHRRRRRRRMNPRTRPRRDEGEGDVRENANTSRDCVEETCDDACVFICSFTMRVRVVLVVNGSVVNSDDNSSHLSFILVPRATGNRRACLPRCTASRSRIGEARLQPCRRTDRTCLHFAPLENVSENTSMPPARTRSVLDGQGAVYECRDACVAAKPIGILEAHHQDVHHLFLVEHRTLPRASAAEEGQNENENGRECVA